MKKKAKKKLKGMTLAEIIISLAVFAMVALILCLMGKSVEANRREATRVNNKINIQGPVAEAQRNSDSLLVNDDYSITVKVKGNDSSETEVKGKLYSTIKYVVEADGTTRPADDAAKANFQYVQISPPAAAVPSAPTT